MLHAPQVVVTPATRGTNEIHVTLYYYNVASTIRKVYQINDVISDIVAFFEECEETGLFKIVD